jgi:hypothetical protein
MAKWYYVTKTWVFVEGLENGEREREAQVRDALLHQEEEKEEVVRTIALCKFVKCYKHSCL